MKICAVICEFNPFHNGHEHLLTSARKQSGCDAILCVMSGNFVQRAEPAIISKQHRTTAALHCGADIVAELPTVYATANAAAFAHGAIEIINRFKGVTHLAFGCEDNTLVHLKTLAEISANETEEFKNILHNHLNQGLSYAKSRALALSEIAEKQGYLRSMSDIILSKPNNLLAIEYIKCLILSKNNISPLPIKREGNNYNDLNISNNLSSASAIRKLLLENTINPSNNQFTDNYQIYIEQLKNNMPSEMLQLLLQPNTVNYPDYKIFSALTVDAIRSNDLSSLPDSGEGLEIKLKKAAAKYSDLNSIIDKVKSKRYTHAKIRRLCLQALLNITRSSIDNPSPIKILGIKKTIKPYLKHLPQNCIIQNKDYDYLTAKHTDYLRIEKKAASVYSLITHADGDQFYGYRLIEV